MSYFDEEDSERYFGREEQIKKLWQIFNHLHQQEESLRLLTILGPSGCGKSSLARAGLIPELARRPLPARKKARVAILTPGTHPVEALAGVLAKIATNDIAPVTKTRELTEELKLINKAEEYDGLRRIADLLPDINSSPLIVLVDQFEEVYSLCKDSSERLAFIENLLHGAGERAARVSVILTLRSDFLVETQKHIKLSKAITRQGFIVPAMSFEELERAISKPAEIGGHPLDKGTIDLLIEQTEGREGALPLLQFALSRIWSGLREGVSPAVTLESIGGVGGALAGEAQRIFDSLSEDEKAIARRVFLGLVQLGEGAKDTRRRAEIENLVAHREQPSQVNKVINKFASKDARLITLSSGDGIETAEVTHEALFDHWGQLNEWLDSSRDDIRFQRRLEDAAQHWHDNNRPTGSLWRSPDLDVLREYYLRSDKDLNQLQLDFFHACEKQATKNLVLKGTLGWSDELLSTVQKRIWGGLKLGLDFKSAWQRATTLNELLKQIEEQRELLPWLLESFWDKAVQDGNEPTKQWQIVGGLGGILAQLAQKTYKKLSFAEQETARRVFLGLIEPGQGTTDTIRSVEVKYLVSHSDQLQRVQQLINHFANDNVRSLSQKAINATTKEVAITHKSLIEQWPQLQFWLSQSREDLKLQRQLEIAVRDWDENGRAEGSLWRSPKLDTLQAYYRDNDKDLTLPQLEFFQASEEQIVKNRLLEGTDDWLNELPALQQRIWKGLKIGKDFQKAIERATTLNELLKQIEEQRELLGWLLEDFWQRTIQDGQEPTKQWQKLGGLGGILAQLAQQTYEQLQHTEQETARRVFLGLIEPGQGTQDQIRQLEIKGLVSHVDKLEEVKELIAQFTNEHVRSLCQTSINDSTLVVAITHKGLIEQWQQLQLWLSQSREDIKLQRQLEIAVRDWDENGRPEGSLWRFPKLDLLQEYYKRNSLDLTLPQLEFFQACDLAEKIRKRNRNLLVLGLSVALILSTAFGIIANIQRLKAKEQTEIAQRQTKIAQLRAAAIEAENLMSTNPVEGLVKAMAAIGERTQYGLATELPRVHFSLSETIDAAKARDKV
nr:ATP-binding protein [Prochloraceae cyanobacterium]